MRRPHDPDKTRGLPAATVIALLGAALAAGCAGQAGAGVDGPSVEDSGAAGEPDVGSQPDSGGEDAGTVQPDAGAPADSGGGEDAVIQPDSALNCPGGPGCDCQEPKNCDNNFCIETPVGFRCAQTCVDSCDEGFKCVSSGGADSTNICVPRWGRLCDPCSANAECRVTGNTDAVCVDRGNAGAFCGSSCSADQDCPSGYACEAGKDVGGKEVKQCVVKNGGACTCSDEAISKELATTCYIAAGDGKCAGKRTCLPDGAAGAPAGGGLSACVAPEPAPEQCDAKDNDCDGQTDEGTCDDDNTCTADLCGGGEGCKYTNQEGGCDADGSVCSDQDLCKDGKCVAGKALDCDDKNPCTADKCDADKGCGHEPTSGSLCNADDNLCTLSDTCQQGVCVAGKKKPCDSGDQCISAKCSIASGTCKYTPKVLTPCNDGNPCTTGDACKDESCTSTKVTGCDDGNPCTADACDVNTGCVHKNAANTCDDGDKCTDNDGCEKGACVGLPKDVTADCGDGNPCTEDRCDKNKGCVNTDLHGVQCDDGNACTAGDACKAGKCVAGPANSCDCTSDADCAKKEDGNACNGTLICDKSRVPFKCAVDPGSVVKCDQSLNNACQKMSCNPADGKCGLDRKSAGTPCDADGSVCTAKDACNAGKCVPGKRLTCDDDNPCTDDGCAKDKGCVYTPNGGFCDADGDKCSQSDKCSAGVCVAGKRKECKDGNACTADFCDRKTGLCKFTPLTVPCDDGNQCTKGEACGKHPDTDLAACIGGKPVDCSDGNPCTKDRCDAKEGCKYTPLYDGAPCDDGNKCTSPDGCFKGVCRGKAIDVKAVCDDDNPCTKDLCTSAKGCQSKPLSGVSCQDGNVCTEGDVCSGGKCVPGTNTCGCTADSDCKAKEDGNVCNGTLFCNKAKAPFQCRVNPATVKHCDKSQDNFCGTNTCNPQTGACTFDKKADKTPCNADDSVCTTNDRCAAGHCKAGVLLKCDDANPCTADTCDAKKGCTHTPQGGTCEADNNACTGPDLCKQGKCVVGGKNDCNDHNACTADSCNTATGKCENKPLQQSCDDGDACTKGDVCGKNASVAWSCLPGKKVNCDDGIVCTVDRCDAKVGCKNVVDTQTPHACYTGPKVTRGVGECKDGKAVCKADGTVAACQGQVKPALKEACDAKDDNCDGTTDEGCAPTGVHLRVGNAVLRGKATKHGVRGSVGVSAAADTVRPPATGAKLGAGWGWYRWLARWLGK